MSKKKLDPANLVLPTAEALPSGAPSVDQEARRKFVEGKGAERRQPSPRAGEGASTAAKPPKAGKKADRKVRQLLVYMSTPELREEVDVRVARERVSLSAFVERLVVAELAKPVKSRR